MGIKSQNSAADQHLIDSVLRGDTNAFKILIHRTEGLVAQIIFRMVPTADDRKDLAQDVYLQAFQKLRGFRFQAKFSTWVAQIAYNTCVNYLKKKKLVLLEDYNSNEESPAEALRAFYEKADLFMEESQRQIINKELSEILKKEIDRLTPLYKTLITLYHNEELSYAEIAQITELPEGTVKNYLFRARRKLRDNLLAIYKRDEI